MTPEEVVEALVRQMLKEAHVPPSHLLAETAA
jgi:hypothetical protein